MKRYKINNRVIEAESLSHALRLNHIIDSNRISDLTFAPLATAGGLKPGNKFKAEYTGNYGKPLKKPVIGTVISNEPGMNQYQRKITYKTPEGKVISENWGVNYLVELYDSVKDEDIDELSAEEQKAIEDYRKAIARTNNPKLLELYAHILKEEVEHLNELQNAKNREFEDSVKDFALFKPAESKTIVAFNNFYSEKDFEQRLKVFTDIDSTDVRKILTSQTAVKAMLEELINDAAVDLKDPSIPKDKTIAHYRKYKDIAKKYLTTKGLADNRRQLISHFISVLNDKGI